MTDEIAVQQTLNTYSVNASLGMLEEMVATFLPDGVWEVPDIGARFESQDSILAGAKSINEPFEYIVQLNSPAIIKVSGDTATARSVIRECAKYAGSQRSLEVLGLYNDKLVRTPDGWKFAVRTFIVRGMHDFENAPPSLHE